MTHQTRPRPRRPWSPEQVAPLTPRRGRRKVITVPGRVDLRSRPLTSHAIVPVLRVLATVEERQPGLLEHLVAPRERPEPPAPDVVPTRLPRRALGHRAEPDRGHRVSSDGVREAAAGGERRRQRARRNDVACVHSVTAASSARPNRAISPTSIPMSTALCSSSARSSTARRTGATSSNRPWSSCGCGTPPPEACWRTIELPSAQECGDGATGSRDRRRHLCRCAAAAPRQARTGTVRPSRGSKRSRKGKTSTRRCIRPRSGAGATSPRQRVRRGSG